jgi:hypothetical protein
MKQALLLLSCVLAIAMASCTSDDQPNQPAKQSDSQLVMELRDYNSKLNFSHPTSRVSKWGTAYIALNDA